MKLRSLILLSTAATALGLATPAFACQKPVESVPWLNQTNYCSAVLKGFSPGRCLRTTDERAADLNFCRSYQGAPYSFQGVE